MSVPRSHRPPRGRRHLRAPVAAAALAFMTLGLALPACRGERAAEEAAEDTAVSPPDYESMSFPYDFSREQKRAVGRFLESRAGWRLAVDSDNQSPFLGGAKRDDPAYEPYYVEGDLTADGAPDFALALTSDGLLYRVVWFRNAGRGYAPGQPVTNVDWLSEGGLFIRNGELMVERLGADQRQRFVWNPERRRLERVERGAGGGRS